MIFIKYWEFFRKNVKAKKFCSQARRRVPIKLIIIHLLNENKPLKLKHWLNTVQYRLNFLNLYFVIAIRKNVMKKIFDISLLIHDKTDYYNLQGGFFVCEWICFASHSSMYKVYIAPIDPNNGQTPNNLYHS